MSKDFKCEYCTERPKDWQGSDPVCLFNEDGTMSKDNWGCRVKSIIEQYINDFRIPEMFSNDECFVTIPLYLPDEEVEEGHDMLFLHLQRYKHRGRAQSISLSNAERTIHYPDFKVIKPYIDWLQSELDRDDQEDFYLNRLEALQKTGEELVDFTEQIIYLVKNGADVSLSEDIILGMQEEVNRWKELTCPDLFTPQYE